MHLLYTYIARSANCIVLLCRFSLEQSQTRGDRLETRLETSLAQLRSRLALQPQASEESTTTQQSGAEEGQEDGTTSTGSTGEVGGASAEVKGEDVSASIAVTQFVKIRDGTFFAAFGLFLEQNSLDSRLTVS